MKTITTEDLFRFKLGGDIQICPGKDLAVYVENQADRKTNGYQTRIMKIWKDQTPEIFTQGPDDHFPRFSPDGQWLAFISKRSGQNQIWTMATDGGEARQLSFIDGGLESFVWAPDSLTLYATALLTEDGIRQETDKENPDEYLKFNQDVKVITELSHKMDGVGFYGKRRPHIVKLIRDKSREPEQLTYGPYRHSQLAVSPDGNQLFFCSRYEEDYDREPFEQNIYRLDLREVATKTRNAPPQRLSPIGIGAYSPFVHPDGSHLFFIGSRTEDLGYDNPSLFVVPLGQPENCRKIAPNWDRPFADESLSDMLGPAGNPLRFDEDGSHIFSLTSDTGSVQLARIDWQRDEVELLTAGSHVVYSYDLDPRRSYAILAVNTPANPTQIEWLDSSSSSAEPIVLTNPNLEFLRSVQLSSPERFRYHTPQGPEIDGWVLPPVNREKGRKYPAVLAIHGGPMMMYADSFFLEFQWLAAHGYAVIYTNPRGSQGYGRDFCLAIQKEWGHLDYEDIMTGLDTALKNHPWIDGERLAVAGGSYGGFMTNWIVGHTHRFKAAITMRSVVDWKAMVGTGDAGWHWMRLAGGVAPWHPDDGWYRRQSPITYVENITTPLLIEHQEGDLRCPIEQGEILFTAVKYLNKAPVKFIRYPDEFHGMSRNGKPWHRIFRLNSFIEWLEDYL